MKELTGDMNFVIGKQIEVVALWTENRKGRIFLMALLKTGKYP
jgi:hypothetical protein